MLPRMGFARFSLQAKSGEFTWSMPMDAADLSVSDADLDLLEAYLLSDQSPPECMLLSDLDGFLTAVAIGPEVVIPSEWLPHVWGGEEPVFDDHLQASAILGTIMGRYNMILREIEEGVFGPLFGETVDGTVIVADWAEGFMQAVALRADAWEPLMRSRRLGACSFRSWPCVRTRMVSLFSGLSLARKTG